MTGTLEGFTEKPGMEPATPGLQDIGLSHTPRGFRSTSINVMSELIVQYIQLLSVGYNCQTY